MPYFNYQALTDRGTLIRGREVATSPEALRSELEGRGLLVRKVRKESEMRLPFRRGRVTAEALLGFNQEMISLLSAGLTLADALEQACEQPEEPRLAQTLTGVLADIREGALFAEACRRYPEVFDPMYLWALQTAEKTGDLVSALATYQKHAERQQFIRHRVVQAMTYPLFLFGTVAVVLTVLFVFVLPRFTLLYADMNTELPWPTRALMTVVDTLPVAAPVLALIILSLVFLYRRWVETDAGRLRADDLLERMPLLGSLRHQLAYVHTARALASFLGAGTPLVDALKATGATLTNRAAAARLLQSADRVTEGQGFAMAATDTGLFPQKALKLIAIGESAGNLATVMGNIADLYEDLLDRRMSRLLTLLEPALMLVIGVFIGGIILIMYLPVFGMAEVIR